MLCDPSHSQLVSLTREADGDQRKNQNTAVTIFSASPFLDGERGRRQHAPIALAGRGYHLKGGDDNATSAAAAVASVTDCAELSSCPGGARNTGRCLQRP